MPPLTLDLLKKDQVVRAYISKANEHLGRLGFTEHGFRHARLTSDIARNILMRVGESQRTVELAEIAAYMHDIGNLISRLDHGLTGALLTERILSRFDFPPEETACVLAAIGNHEEEYGKVVNTVAAALILADKSDVHRSRVRNDEIATFDIHDRVNYAVERSFVKVNADEKKIDLELRIDTEICPVMEYFEIFLSRMLMCRRAAEWFDCRFGLVVNGSQLL